MDKKECKKYLARSYRKILKSKKNLSTSNIEIEMKNVMNEQILEYIAYSKIAVNNIQKSGNLKVKLKDILSQIDILPQIYSKEFAIKKANKL